MKFQMGRLPILITLATILAAKIKKRYAFAFVLAKFEPTFKVSNFLSVEKC